MLSRPPKVDISMGERNRRFSEKGKGISVSNQRLLTNKAYTPSRVDRLSDIEDKLKSRDRVKSQERNSKILNIYAALESFGQVGKSTGFQKQERKEDKGREKKNSIDFGASSSAFYRSKRVTSTPDRTDRSRVDRFSANEQNLPRRNSRPNMEMVKIHDVLKNPVKTPDLTKRYIETHHHVPQPNLHFKEHYGSTKENSRFLERTKNTEMQAETGSTASKNPIALSSKSIFMPGFLSANLASKSKDRILNSLKETRTKLDRSSDKMSQDLREFKPKYHSHLTDLAKLNPKPEEETKSMIFFGQSHATYNNTLLKHDLSYFERIISRDYLSVSSQTGNLKDASFSLFFQDCKEQVQILKMIEDDQIRGESIRASLITLPMSLKTRCIYVDLDETLVRTEREQEGKKYDDIVNIRAMDGEIEVKLLLFSELGCFTGRL